MLFSIDKLGLEKDQEFIRLMSESMMRAKMKANQAMGGMGGPGGQGMRPPAMGMGDGMQNMQGMF